MIIEGDLNLKDCKNLVSLDNLKKIGGNLWLNDCSNLKDLGNLKDVGDKIYLKNSGITKEYVRKFNPNLLDKCDWDLYDF